MNRTLSVCVCVWFKVGLVSELFSEMLQRDFGLQLYHSLCSLPQTPTATLPEPETQTEDTRATLVHTSKVNCF